MYMDLITEEYKLQRVKRLLDAEVKIDAIVNLLLSKGVITMGELDDATTKMETSERYNFYVHEAEEDIKVFNAMMDTCLKERARLHGLLNDDGTLRKDKETGGGKVNE